MNQILQDKIISYYEKYYRDDCSLPNYQNRARRRLKEEENEYTRLIQLEKNLNTSFQNQKHFIVGAGTGGLAITLHQHRHCQIYGLEPNSEGLAIIKDKCALHNINPDNFKLEYAEKISQSNNQFDLVHCYTVLEHVTDISKSLDEMIRITKPGGHIYINTPNYAYPYEGHYKIPFPTFLPKIFGYLYLILLRKSPSFLKTINFITESDLDRLLAQKKNITWQRFYAPLTKSRGRIGWLLNFYKFKRLIHPQQEIAITKHA